MIKVLLVEDDDLCRNLGLRVLNLFDGIQVFSSATGHRALELCLEHQFELIIVDLNLPDTSGYALAPMMKRHTPQPFIVAITAQLSEGSPAPEYIDKLYTKPLTYPLFEEILMVKDQ